jgi:sugar lactone lactonase YvrE
MFNQPFGIAVDGSGNLYVTDPGAGKVQRFGVTGAFSGALGKSNAGGMNCVVGGAQTAWCTGGSFATGTVDGTFNLPSGLAVDGSGNLYVSDETRGEVQRFNSTGGFTGAIGYSTAAGTSCTALGTQSSWCVGGSFAGSHSEGGFYYPIGLAVDGSGNLFVAEFYGNRLDKFASSTGAFAGAWGASVGAAQPSWGITQTSNSGSGDGAWYSPSQAAPLAGGDLVVVDAGNQRVCKVHASTGAIAGCIGSGAVAAGTCVSGKQSGWCTGGTFQSGAGDGMFNTPSAVATDASGNVYVTDIYNSRVQKFGSNGAFVGSIGYASATSGTCTSGARQSGWCTGGTFVSKTTDGTFDYPSGIAVDNSAVLYVSDLINHRIEKFDAASGSFQGSIGKTSGGGTCATGAAQSAWCTGGTFVSGTGDGMFYSPHGLAVDSFGYLYVADYQNSRVQRIATANVSDASSIGGTTSSAGNCAASGKQTQWCTGGTFGYAIADGQFSFTVGVAVDTNSNLYVSEQTGGLQKFSPTGAFVGWMGEIGAAPLGGDAGCLSASIGSLTPGWCTGGTTVAAEQGLIGGLGIGPGFLSVDANGILYAADTANHRILRIVP